MHSSTHLAIKIQNTKKCDCDCCICASLIPPHLKPSQLVRLWWNVKKYWFDFFGDFHTTLSTLPCVASVYLNFLQRFQNTSGFFSNLSNARSITFQKQSRFNSVVNGFRFHALLMASDCVYIVFVQWRNTSQFVM